ncbi:MAG: hypothetical protein Q4D71_10875 [Oscillospiraceae bacterium]|nr:hypothetical protein [Oscillospiraceae bacterium]
MSIVKLKDKRTGTTYVYESESYWDKEKKQPRSRRKLIGKLDEKTGEIVPTGKSGRKKGSAGTADTSPASEPITEYVRVIEEKDALIRELKAENKALKKAKQEILQSLEALCSRMAE